MCSSAWLPAGVSLTAAGVDALGQGLVQSGIDHVQTDGFLMHLAAGIPVRNAQKVKVQQGAGTVHCFGQKLFSGRQPPSRPSNQTQIQRNRLKKGNQSTSPQKECHQHVNLCKAPLKGQTPMLLDTKHRGEV